MSFICQIATANPEFCHKQTDISEFMLQIYQDVANQKRKIQLLYKKTAIKTRYSVLSDYSDPKEKWTFYPKNPQTQAFPSTHTRMEIFDQKALPLALNAVKNLKNIDFKKITHLITVTCTGLAAPGLEIALLNALELPKNTIRVGINFMGCYAGFQALRIADAFCNTNPDAQVLIVDVELCTLHFQTQQTDDNLMANAIFADGASAILVKAQKDKGKYKYLEIKGLHSFVEPKGEADMAWKVGNTGFEMRLSSYIPQIIESNLAKLIENTLAEAKLPYDFIKHWAIHPGGKAILETVEKQLHLPENSLRASWEVLENHGNMSSATIFYVLKSIWESDANFEQNQGIFACGFGPGLTMETAILEATN